MKMPYFPFYPQDWLTDERVVPLTYELRGAYHHLLCWMWKFEGCILPDDDKYVAQILNVNPRTWRRFKAVLLDGDMPVLTRVEAGFTQNRLANEQRKVAELSAKNAATARERWANARVKPLKTHETVDANAVPEKSFSQYNTDSDSDTDIKRTPLKKPPQGGASLNGSKRLRKRDITPWSEIGRMLEEEDGDTERNY